MEIRNQLKFSGILLIKKTPSEREFNYHFSVKYNNSHVLLKKALNRMIAALHGCYTTSH